MEFLNGAFLVGAGTALVPILIHLIQRRRAQRIIFGSLRFLRKTSHRIVRRRRFEEVLLVVLRALALGLLAAAFARPFFRKPAEAAAGGEALAGEEAALVLIDNSYSMGAEGRLDRARQEGLRFLREADPAAKVGVATFSSRFEELCPIGAKPAQAEEAVKSVTRSWRGTNLDLALKQAGRVLTRAGRGEAYRRIVLIADFQDSSWRDRGEWALPPGVELTIRNVARQTVPNVLVGRVAVPRLVVAGGFVEVVSATVRNLTDRALSDARVTLRVDGEEKATRTTVNLDPRAEAPVRFSHTFADAGDVTGSIAVQAADDLPEDDVAYFCVHVTPRVRVLLVNADRDERMVLNDGLFLTAALAPKVEGVVSPFEVRQIAPDQMTPADLQGIDVVLLVNVARLPAAVTGVPSEKQGGQDAAFQSPLGRFIAAGGGVGFLCGSKVSPAEFNRTFAGLAPCRLSGRAMQEGDPPVVINRTDPRHEIFAEFALPHSGDVSLAEFTQYFLVTDSLRARVPARFSSAAAHPALLESTFDQPAGAAGGEAGAGAAPPRVKGRSILFVSSMDLEWNNLCLKSVFVPLVHQLTKRLCSRRAGSARDVTVGQEVVHRLPGPTGKVTLRHGAAAAAGGGPGGAEAGGAKGTKKVQWGEPVALTVQSTAAGAAVSFTPERPGVYELAYDGGAARFAVNLDADEPDLRPMDTKLLLTAVQKGPVLAGDRPAGAGAVAARADLRERIEARQRIWRYLLAAALVILAVEMLLAARIGRA